MLVRNAVWNLAGRPCPFWWRSSPSHLSISDSEFSPWSGGPRVFQPSFHLGLGLALTIAGRRAGWVSGSQRPEIPAPGLDRPGLMMAFWVWQGAALVILISPLAGPWSARLPGPLRARVARSLLLCWRPRCRSSSLPAGLRGVIGGDTSGLA